MRPATFAELWACVIVLAGFSLVLAGSGLFLMRVEEPKLPQMAADMMAQLERAALNPESPQTRPPRDDDGRLIELREPSGSWKANVFWSLRNDVGQKLRDLDDVGRPRFATKPLDTMAPIVLNILRDTQGKELLRLDQNMEPASEMRRFLDRMENLIGNPIIDE